MARTAGEFADHIVNLTADPAARARLVASAYRLVLQRYSLDHVRTALTASVDRLSVSG